MTALIKNTVVENQPLSKKCIKLLVWDLDNTLWNGVLLEDKKVTLRPDVVNVIRELDERGILNSIASRNDFETASQKLEEFGLREYFLSPQINWGAKSDSIQSIVQDLNIGMDVVAFVDDQPFERDEVLFTHPGVRTFDAGKVNELCNMDCFKPAVITSESKKRRSMYMADLNRVEAEQITTAPIEEFLASLEMKFTIKEATKDDLLRAEELTQRTNQLNTTGRTYSFAELDQFRTSPDHILLMSRLEDCYGPYGTIGLALIETNQEFWNIQLLLMSCRVMSRGVGSIMMNYIRNRARDANIRLQSEFIANNRNRMMYATYKFSGFKEINRRNNEITFECDLALPAKFPDYVELVLPI